MKDPSAIYDAAWFKKDFDHPGVKEDFFVIADAIYRQFRPTFVYDYGCGPGMILERLVQLGVWVKGYEGSTHGIAHAHESVRKYLEHADLTTMEPTHDTPSDGVVVICTEVAEHLEAQHANHLVDLLCAHMAPVVFTAAPPGQGGHDHVNEQERYYWMDKFEARGALLDERQCSMMRQRMHHMRALAHMPRNIMVFS